MGSSLIFHAYEHPFLNYKNQHLLLEPHDIKLRWFGKRGMVWEDVETWFHELVFRFGYPDVLMLLCGGNSIGTMSLRHLQKFMKLTISNILAVRPNCKIICHRFYQGHITGICFTCSSGKRSSYDK